MRRYHVELAPERKDYTMKYNRCQQSSALYLVVVFLWSIQGAVVVDTDGGDIVSLCGVRHHGDVGYMALSV